MSISTEDISKLIETLTPVFGAADAAARVRRIAVSDAEKAEVREYLVSIGVEVEQIQEELDRRKDKLGRIQKIIDRCPELKTDHELLKLLLNAPLVRIVSVLAALAFCTALAGASRGGINPKLQAVISRMLKAKSWQGAHEMEKAIAFLRANHHLTQDTLDGLISRDFSEAETYAKTVNELSNVLIALEEGGGDRAAIVAKVARSLEVSKEEQAERRAYLRSRGDKLEDLSKMRAFKLGIAQNMVLQVYPQLKRSKSLFEAFLGMKYQNMCFLEELLLPQLGQAKLLQECNVKSVIGLCHTQNWQKVEAFSHVILSLSCLSELNAQTLRQETFDETIAAAAGVFVPGDGDLAKTVLDPVRIAAEFDLRRQLHPSCHKLIPIYIRTSKEEREIISPYIDGASARKPVVSHTASIRKLQVLAKLIDQVGGLKEDYNLLKSLSRPGTLLKLVAVWGVLEDSGVVELNKKNLEFVVKVAQKDQASVDKWVILLGELHKSNGLNQDAINKLASLDPAQCIHAWKSMVVSKLGEGVRGVIEKYAEASKKERREWKQYCAGFSIREDAFKIEVLYHVVREHHDKLKEGSDAELLNLFLSLELCQLGACDRTLVLMKKEKLATSENIKAVIKVYQRTKNWQEAKAVNGEIEKLLDTGAFNQGALDALTIPVSPRNWKPIIIGATVVGVSLLVVGGVAAVCFFAPGAFALVGVAGVASSFIAAMSAMGTFVAHVALPAVAQFLFALGAALLNLIGVSAAAHVTAAVATGVIAPVVTLGAVAATGKLAYDYFTKPAKPRDERGEAGDFPSRRPDDCFDPWGESTQGGRCWAAPAK